MTEKYISLEDAAKFEGIKYNTLVQKLQRKPECYKTIMQPSESGGKNRVMIDISSLSKKGMAAYTKSKQISFDEFTIDKVTDEEAPWYVSADINEYIEENKKAFYEAIEFTKVINKFLDYEGKNKTDFAKNLAKDNGISQRSLYGQAEKYLEAGAWAMKINAMDGANYEYFKVLALCRKPKDKNTFPSIDAQVKVLIENIKSDKKLAKNRISVSMIYEKLIELCPDKGLPVPSSSTVYRYVEYIQKKNEGSFDLVEGGTNEYNRNRMLKASRSTKSLAVMEIVQGDGHTFDCFVKYTHPNGKVTAIKPTLIAWIDTRSRVIVGDVMCVNSNAQATKQSVLNMIYNYGVPKYQLIDNGKEFTAKSLIGRNRNERVCIEVDESLLGFYKSIGIDDDIRALPYHPWIKAEIERLFLTICNKFTKWFNSYVGTLTGSKTAAKIDKDINKMLKNDELVSFEEFYKLWEKWKNEKYHNKDHGGLKKMGEQWRKPIELFKNAEEKYLQAPPPKEYAIAQLMTAEEASVTITGIRRFGYEYRSVELGNYVGKRVKIKYDPQDVTVLYVYDKDTNETICEAPCWELLNIAPRVPQEAVKEHKILQNTQKKIDRDNLKWLQTPYEEREQLKELVEQHVNHEGKIKGFVIENTKTKVKELENVIALPVTKHEVKKDKVKTDYYKKQGEEVFKQIQNLG